MTVSYNDLAIAPVLCWSKLLCQAVKRCCTTWLEDAYVAAVRLSPHRGRISRDNRERTRACGAVGQVVVAADRRGSSRRAFAVKRRRAHYSPRKEPGYALVLNAIVCRAQIWVTNFLVCRKISTAYGIPWIIIENFWSVCLCCVLQSAQWPGGLCPVWHCCVSWQCCSLQVLPGSLRTAALQSHVTKNTHTLHPLGFSSR